MDNYMAIVKNVVMEEVDGKRGEHSLSQTNVILK